MFSLRKFFISNPLEVLKLHNNFFFVVKQITGVDPPGETALNEGEVYFEIQNLIYRNSSSALCFL